MKRSIKKIAVCSILAALLALSAVNVFAKSTADASEPIDVSKKCSLTLTYAVDGKRIQGLEIELFQTAAVSEDFQYTLTGAFAAFPIAVNHIKTQSEWDEVKDTVGAYVVADQIAPTLHSETNEEGIVRFDDLSVGLYYVRCTGNAVQEQVQDFAPFLISVPGLGEDGKWIYDMDALPKPGKLPDPDKQEMTLMKLWNDGNQSSKRPLSISVDIFKNGELFENVQLTAENNWTYVWETEGNETWTAVERDVPEGYSVSVQNRDANTIQITNSLSIDPPPPPVTGDDFHLLFWVGLMMVSGIGLIAACFIGRKKYEE